MSLKDRLKGRVIKKEQVEGKKRLKLKRNNNEEIRFVGGTLKRGKMEGNLPALSTKFDKKELSKTKSKNENKYFL